MDVERPPCSALESPSDLQQEYQSPSHTRAPATVETTLSFWPVPHIVSYSEWGHNDGLVPVIAVDRTKVGSKKKRKKRKNSAELQQTDLSLWCFLETSFFTCFKFDVCILPKLSSKCNKRLLAGYSLFNNFSISSHRPLFFFSSRTLHISNSSGKNNLKTCIVDAE